PIDRLHELWGRELADTLLPIGHREGPLEVRGFAQRPAQAKPAGRKGYVLVRGRPIRDPFILRAGESGYRSTIAPADRPTHILFQTDPAVAIVDPHSAHERVLYEAVMRPLSGDGAPGQRLLLPLTLDFSATELEAVDAHGELLRRVGYEIEPFSGRSVVVHTA